MLPPVPIPVALVPEVPIVEVQVPAVAPISEVASEENIDDNLEENVDDNLDSTEEKDTNNVFV